jgi:hypothetical protein
MSYGNRACGSYGPGHLVHWIQAKKSHEEGQPVIKLSVVAVHDDGRVEIEGDDLTLTLWHHAPGQLRSAIRYGGRAEWMPRYHGLYVISVGLFNLATLGKREPCVPPARQGPTESTTEFVQRAMRENRGYTVPSRSLLTPDAVPGQEKKEPQEGGSTATPFQR